MPRGGGRLSARQKAALSGEILLAYARTRLLIAREPLPKALARARDTRPDAAPASGDEQLVSALRLGNAVVRTLAAVPMDSTCLIRSLVLTSLLARRGIESSLVIGARRCGDFEAHAWVEHGDRPVLPDRDYPRLVAL